MWPDIHHLPMPVSLIAGARDAKFVTVSSHMHRVMQQQRREGQQSGFGKQQSVSEQGGQQLGKGEQLQPPPTQVELHIIPGAGHAVHVERPMQLLQLLSRLGRQQ